ncbi:MAG: ATP-binding cassette domain-containing protein [Acidobacteriota bacterium]
MLTVNAKKRFADAGRSGSSIEISFEAGNGFTVVLGPSGSGKSTTLKMIAGIIRPDSGLIKLGDRVFFDSYTGTDLAIKDRRVGFVFQDYALFPHLSAEKNIAFGIKGSDARSKAETSLSLLTLFHIEHVRHRLPAEMSGGEQQRVAVARALASDPSIVLLDEPLSAVDQEMRSRLLDEIVAAQNRSNIPFIYVTHNISEAERLGGNRIILADPNEPGRIEA